MNYDLALRLKKAGFPMPKHDYDDGAFGSCHRDCVTGSDFCFPTLSELIGACGKKFDFLRRDEKTWRAVGKNCFAIDNSPEEAVANLWLVLHEKI